MLRMSTVGATILENVSPTVWYYEFERFMQAPNISSILDLKINLMSRDKGFDSR